MNKIPKFAIRFQAGGNTYTAFFKPTGVPGEVKVSILLRKQLLASYKTNVPKSEILSWSQFVIQTMPKELKNEPNSPTRVPLPGAVPVRKDGSEPTGDDKVLSRVRGGSNSKERVLFAKDADPLETYQTAQSKDPKKTYLCRLMGPGKHKDTVVLHTYFPPPLAEWKDVEVSGTYLLRPHKGMAEENHKEKQTMPKKELVEPSNAPTATSKAGLSVYEAWGKAFEMHATKKNAPELIVAFMEKQFPGRKTKWAKWVNAVRARYNAGKLPGVRAPKEKIAVYAFGAKPSRSGERRAKERRTVPLKTVRTKTPSKSKPEEPEPVA